MPNWCHNTLRVDGEEEDVLRFVQKVREPQSGQNHDRVPMVFSSILPEPDDIGDGWYDWRVSHWGTKWEPSFSGAGTLDEGGDFRRAEGSAEYYFDTAWGPPLEWISEAAKMFPKLVFTITYGEPGMDFGGKCVLSGEDTISVEEGDARTYLDEEMLWF